MQTEGRNLFNRFLSLLMLVILAAGLLLAPLTWLAAWRTGPFPWKALQITLFSGIVLEKLWAMFFRMPQRFSTQVRQDWTTVSVGLSFTAVMYLTGVEIFWPLLPWRSGVPTAIGALLTATGIALRHWASLHLGRQWTVHLDQQLSERILVTDGPYGWVRHPLYLAACLESVGVPLLFQAYGATCLAALLFVPLEVQRARFEERYLEKIFGSAYHEYRSNVRGFLPVRRS